MLRKDLAIIFASAAFAFTAAVAQQPPSANDGVVPIFPGVGQVPNLLPKSSLLDFDEVQAELKITEAQKKELGTIRERATKKFQQKMQEMRKNKKNVPVQDRIQIRDAFINEAQTAIDETLTAEQRAVGPDPAPGPECDGLRTGGTSEGARSLSGTDRADQEDRRRRNARDLARSGGRRYPETEKPRRTGHHR